MDIEFEGQYDKQQYFRAVALAGKPSRGSVLKRVAFFVVFAALAAGYVFTLMRDQPETGLPTARLVKYSVLALVLLYFVFQPYLQARQAASRLWKDPLVRRKIRGSVSSLGITVGTFTQKWEEYAFKFCTDEQVVLLTAGRSMTCLPRSFFKDEHDWTRFCQMVEQKVIAAQS